MKKHDHRNHVESALLGLRMYRWVGHNKLFGLKIEDFLVALQSNTSDHYEKRLSLFTSQTCAVCCLICDKYEKRSTLDFQ